MKEPKEKKEPKSKKQFQLTIEFWDDGKIGTVMEEWKMDSAVEKKRRYNHESAAEFREAIHNELARNDHILARDILIKMGIDPRDFATYYLSTPIPMRETAPVAKVDSEDA
jgi:hypothetical protein